MGWLTSEELWWDDKGRLRTHGPSTYKIPGSRDVPPIFNARILADAPNREDTIFRSKAVGEPPLMLAISVWLAIRDAVASLADYKVAPDLDAPATPERVLKAVDANSRRIRPNFDHRPGIMASACRLRMAAIHWRRTKSTPISAREGSSRGLCRWTICPIFPPS